MTRLLRNASVSTLAVIVVIGTIPSAAFAVANDSARLEGYVVGLDGRPAPDHGVVLVDDRGEAADRAVSDDEGVYRFASVEPGDYGLALELPDGTVAPVTNASAELSAGELARRDIRLMTAESGASIAPGQTHGGLGVWWAGLSGAAKAGVIIGGVAGIWLIYEALDSDDDTPQGGGEPPGSASLPPS